MGNPIIPGLTEVAAWIPDDAQSVSFLCERGHPISARYVKRKSNLIFLNILFVTAQHLVN